MCPLFYYVSSSLRDHKTTIIGEHEAVQWTMTVEGAENLEIAPTIKLSAVTMTDRSRVSRFDMVPSCEACQTTPKFVFLLFEWKARTAQHCSCIGLCINVLHPDREDQGLGGEVGTTHWGLQRAHRFLKVVFAVLCRYKAGSLFNYSIKPPPAINLRTERYQQDWRFFDLLMHSINAPAIQIASPWNYMAKCTPISLLQLHHWHQRWQFGLKAKPG